MQAVFEALAASVANTIAPAAGRALGGILVLLIAWRLATVVRDWFARASARSRADANHRLLVARFLYLIVLIYGLIWGLEVFGVSPAALVTAIGVVGLAASLALQDLLKNLCAGIYLLFERPFRIGDEIGVREYRGRVADIGIRVTSLHTEDRIEVLIPNAIVLAEVVVNRSGLAADDESAVPDPRTG